jgi:hypothetical protein
MTRLDDETYRTMLRAKIAANHFDGTLPSYQTSLSYIMTGTGVDAWSIDNQDMTLTVRLSGAAVSPVLITLLKTGVMPAKPFGVGLGVQTLDGLADENDIGLADENGVGLGDAPVTV